VKALLAGIGVGIVVLLGAALAAAAGVARSPVIVVALVTGGVAIAALGALAVRVLRRFDALERLRGDLAAMAAYGAPPGRPPPDEEMDADIARLTSLLAGVGARMAGERTRHDTRLAAVIAAMEQAVVVATDAGQVSLVNAAAKALLGPERVAVGTSLFAALDRDGAIAAAAEARARNAPCAVDLRTVTGRVVSARVADLGDHAGTLFVLPAAEATAEAGVDHDLSLHDAAPVPAGPPMPETRLDELAVAILDVETTGLDVRDDRLVAVALVPVRGRRIFRGDVIDRLVNPGVPIPARSTAFHGLTDGMVKDAPKAAAVLPEITRALENRVVVGHQIGFDLAVLANEAARAGIEWHPPPSLDLLQLAAALEPRESDQTLDAMALRFGVPIVGRHTALGDALVTAEIYVRLLPRLAERGIETLESAEDFAADARTVIRQQRAAGW